MRSPEASDAFLAAIARDFGGKGRAAWKLCEHTFHTVNTSVNGREMIIINADDFGRTVAETDTATALVTNQRVTSVSAMVFMQDSERAAEMAAYMEIDVGLHLNFCEPWRDNRAPRALVAQQELLVSFFSRSRYTAVLYNPLLKYAFEAVYHAQLEEFYRLYKRSPSHVDGHRHLHLCTNMLIDPLIPRGSCVRRNFTFASGEKGLLNRAYRRLVDTCLGRRYVLTDYFFSLEQCLNGRGRALSSVAELAQYGVVEVMTHPRNSVEFEYLAGEHCRNVLDTVARGTYRELPVRRRDQPFMLSTLLMSLCQCL